MNKKHRKKHLRKRKSDLFEIEDYFDLGDGPFVDGEERTMRRMRWLRRRGDADRRRRGA